MSVRASTSVRSGTVEGEGDAEIRHHRYAQVQQYVLRFHVSVENLSVVRVLQRVGDPHSNLNRLIYWKLSFVLDPISEILSLDRGHHVIQQTIALARVV